MSDSKQTQTKPFTTKERIGAYGALALVSMTSPMAFALEGDLIDTTGIVTKIQSVPGSAAPVILAVIGVFAVLIAVRVVRKVMGV